MKNSLYTHLKSEERSESDWEFEELAEQFLEKIRADESPQLADFAQQYPQYAVRFAKVLPLLIEMEGLGEQENMTLFQNIDKCTTPVDKNEIPDLTGSDFRLLKKIGSGGMGTVFEALQVSLNRKTAVKLLSSTLLSDPTQRRQFENESRVIAMLHHPNIVKVFSAGCVNGYYYYAMELIDGQQLDKVSFDSSRAIAEAGLQAARALSYAHSCGVMHRDIKPANLLLDTNRELRVSDFGIAHLLNGQAEMVETGPRSGTLRYMAPERLKDGINSFSTDQYSLGATLYEIVAGAPLVKANNIKQLTDCICSGAIEPLKGPSDLAAIINKSFSFRPEDRYASMDEMAADLRRFLNNEPVHAALPSVSRRLLLWAKRKPVVAALSVLSGVCAVAFLVALTIGYVQTTAALKLAQRNAAVAQKTFSRVFRHVDSQMPTPSSSALLAELLPYYQGIVEQRGQPISEMTQAYSVIGAHAMQTGDYVRAGLAFERLVQLQPGPRTLFLYSQALRKQGQEDKADIICRQIIDQYADSQDPEELFQVVVAGQSVSERSGRQARIQAVKILTKLLESDPDNPDYRFRYALEIAEDPENFRSEGPRLAGLEPNACVLLQELVLQYPQRTEFALTLVRIVAKKIRYARKNGSSIPELPLTVELATELLGRFPTAPQVVDTCVSFQTNYIDYLRKTGNLTAASRETERFTGVLGILSRNVEVSDSVRESLIEFQLERLQRLIRDKRKKEAKELCGTIAGELKHYEGSLEGEFQNKFAELSGQDELSSQNTGTDIKPTLRSNQQ